jgi:uncharacterized protein YqgC (DUF456 family)
MKRHVKHLMTFRVFRITAGAGCMLLGVAGLILPIMPGWPFIFYGLELLGLGFLIPVFIKDLMRKFEHHTGIRKKR